MVRKMIAPSWSIARKFLVLLLVIFLPASLVIIRSGFMHRGEVVRGVEYNTRLVVESLAAQQEQIAIGTKQMLGTLALLPEVQRLDTAACNELFRELHRRHPYYSIISASTLDGHIFAASIPFEPDVSLSDRKHFREAVETLDFSAGEYGVGRVSNIPTIHYSFPVQDRDKNTVAVLTAGFMLDEYARFMTKAHLPKGSALVVTDYKGVRLYRLPANDATALGKPIPQGSLEAMAAGGEEGTYERIAEDGINRFYTFKKLRLRDDSPPYLCMFVGTAKEKILQEANDEMLADLSVLGMAAFVAVCLAWLIGNLAFIKPLDRLVKAARRFGRGEMETRTGLPHTDDELGQLAQSFDEMVALLGVRDIERRQAERALIQSEERFRRAMEAVSDGLWDWDVANGAVYLSPGYFRMLGYEPGELKSALETWLELVHPDDRDRALAANEACIRNEAPVVYVEFRMRARNGSWRWILGRGKAVLRDAAGRALHMIGTHVDITEQKRAQEEKEKLEAQLRHVHKMEAVGTLAGGIAHDFNNILAAVIGYTEMALTDVPRFGHAKRFLDEVLKAGHRAKELVKQILAFSRMQQRRERLPVHIAPLIGEALKLLRASLPSTVEIRRKIEGETGTVLADATEIHQVLINLCTNAAQAMEERGGLLEVGLDGTVVDDSVAVIHKDLAPGDYIRLTVSDTGHGMEPDILERIFDPYFTTKEVGRGSGLGLAVVHGIVKRHQGAIDVCSKPGEGTTFTVYLPMVERGVTAPVQTERQTPIPRGGERILLIDDEQALADLGKEMLERLGYSVLAKTSAVEALEAFQAGPETFELIITDYTMPRMTGADLAGEMLRIRPDIPVILCTGFTEKIEERKARAMGISAFVLKPLNQREMGEVVRRTLDNVGQRIKL